MIFQQARRLALSYLREYVEGWTFLQGYPTLFGGGGNIYINDFLPYIKIQYDIRIFMVQLPLGDSMVVDEDRDSGDILPLTSANRFSMTPVLSFTPLSLLDHPQTLNPQLSV